MQMIPKVAVRIAKSEFSENRLVFGAIQFVDIFLTNAHHHIQHIDVGQRFVGLELLEFVQIGICCCGDGLDELFVVGKSWLTFGYIPMFGDDGRRMVTPNSRYCHAR